MSLAEVVGDLLELQNLAQDEENPERRRSLDDLRVHVARRERGAKVSEAAEILGISQPTVRAWIDSAILTAVPGAEPVRIDVLALAETKRALDLIRDHVDDRPLLIHVMRILRDRAALAGSEEGFADLREGRTVPLGEDLAGEIAELHARETRRRSKSR
ncbi:MAG: helix-turn-helix domain-containing protein [Acidimicrobiales bacterium]